MGVDSVFRSETISMKSLSVASRSLSTMLHAGVSLRKAFSLAADKVGDPLVGQAFAGVVDAIESGSDLETALRDQGPAFPRLYIDMLAVGEQTGTLPEVLRSLADHYENNVRLRNGFIKSITWPVIEFTLAVLVIAFLILVLGWIAEVRGGEPLDVLGWGLTGTTGAIVWLSSVAGVAAAMLIGFRLIRQSFEGRQALDRLLLRLPVVGNCLRSFGIARFSWAFSLTQQSGMDLKHSLRASLLATSNGAFVEMGPVIWREIAAGEPLSVALSRCGLFPEDYVQMVLVSETSGTVPEALARLSPQFEDDARRSLTTLVHTLSWSVRVMVGIFIVFVIFSVFGWYIGILDEAIQQAR